MQKYEINPERTSFSLEIINFTAICNKNRHGERIVQRWY